MIIVIAFDPGITTGYAVGVVDVEKGRMKVNTYESKFSHLQLFKYLQELQPNWIIFEKFEYRNRARPGLELFSREMIGVINLYIEYTGITKTEQMPAEAKGYHTDKKLKQNLIYKTGMPHANDACRHLLHWYEFGPGYQFNKEGYFVI